MSEYKKSKYIAESALQKAIETGKPVIIASQKYQGHTFMISTSMSECFGESDFNRQFKAYVKSLDA